jgi:hypothetical protein
MKLVAAEVRRRCVPRPTSVRLVTSARTKLAFMGSFDLEQLHAHRGHEPMPRSAAG